MQLLLHFYLLFILGFADLDVFHKGYARAKDSSGWFHINVRGEDASKGCLLFFAC